MQCLGYSKLAIRKKTLYYYVPSIMSCAVIFSLNHVGIGCIYFSHTSGHFVVLPRFLWCTKHFIQTAAISWIFFFKCYFIHNFLLPFILLHMCTKVVSFNFKRFAESTKKREKYLIHLMLHLHLIYVNLF